VTCSSEGTALTPPLFLPVVLLAGAVAARRPGRPGRVGAGITSVVALLFLAGSTANLPNDFAAADAAGTPRALTAGLAGIHIALSVAVLHNGLPTVRGRRAVEVAAAGSPNAAACGSNGRRSGYGDCGRNMPRSR